MTGILPGVRIMADRLSLDSIRARYGRAQSPFPANGPEHSPAGFSSPVSGEPGAFDHVTADALRSVRIFQRDDAWAVEQMRRETADSIAARVRAARRWEVTIDPGDGRARYFVMNGSHAEVLLRARALFSKPAALVLSPLAGAGGESVDSGLTTIPTKDTQMKIRNVTSNVQRGFTLIELMIVVAVIGILVAIAVPAYRSYTTRAQVTEAINMIAGLKPGIAEYNDSRGDYPLTNAAAGIPTTGLRGKYVASVDVTAGGALIAEFSSGPPVAEPPRGLKIAFGFGHRGTSLADASPNIAMTCGLQPMTAGAGYVAMTEDNATLTTVPSDLLPSSCKA